MTFTPKTWQNAPSTSTPISAAALIDLETRLAAYTDSAAQRLTWFDVQKYGAVGDGSTDDRAAIQAAASAIPASGGVLYLSPCTGGYGINPTSGGFIALPSNVIVLGSGYAGRIVRIGTYTFGQGGNNGVFKNADTTNGNKHIWIKDVFVDGLMSTRIAAAISSGATSITLDDATGLPSSGSANLIEKTTFDYISWTSKSGNTLNGVSGVTHSYTVSAIVQKVDFPVSMATGSVASGATSIALTDASRFSSGGGTIQLSLNHVHSRCTYTGKSGNTLTGVSGNTVTFASAPAVAWDLDNISGTFAVMNSNSDSAHQNRGIGFLGCVIANWGGTSIDIRQTDNAWVLACRIKDSLGGGIICRNTVRQSVTALNEVDRNYDDGIAYNSNNTVRAEHITIGLNTVYKEESLFAQGNAPLSLRGVGRTVASLNDLEGGYQGVIELKDTDTTGTKLSHVRIHNNNLKGGDVPVAGVWYTGQAAVANQDVTVTDNDIDNCTEGLHHDPTPATSDGFRFHNNNLRTVTTDVNLASGSPVNSQFGPNRMSGVAPPATVASATTITLPNYTDHVKVTGTTTITSVTASWEGRKVTLVFSGALTFTNGSNLKLDRDFVTAANGSITLISDGTNWNEVGRSTPPAVDLYVPTQLAAGRVTTAGASGTTYLIVPGTSDFAASSAITGASLNQRALFNFLNARYLLATKTLKMRLGVTVGVGGTAPAVTFTFNLSPFTISGGNLTKGTDVAGSTVTITTPGANAFTSGDSTDFTIPADGIYGVTYTVSGTPASNTPLFYTLSVHNT